MDQAEANRRIAETFRLVGMTPDQRSADYAARMVGRDIIAGLGISTAHTGDHGFETALLTASAVHPVERYPDREAAVLGHARWCRLAETVVEVTQLGLPEVGIEEKVVRVVRGYGE